MNFITIKTLIKPLATELGITLAAMVKLAKLVFTMAGVAQHGKQSLELVSSECDTAALRTFILANAKVGDKTTMIAGVRVKNSWPLLEALGLTKSNDDHQQYDGNNESNGAESEPKEKNEDYLQFESRLAVIEAMHQHQFELSRGERNRLDYCWRLINRVEFLQLATNNPNGHYNLHDYGSLIKAIQVWIDTQHIAPAVKKAEWTAKAIELATKAINAIQYFEDKTAECPYAYDIAQVGAMEYDFAVSSEHKLLTTDELRLLFLCGTYAMAGNEMRAHIYCMKLSHASKLAQDVDKRCALHSAATIANLYSEIVGKWWKDNPEPEFVKYKDEDLFKGHRKAPESPDVAFSCPHVKAAWEWLRGNCTVDIKKANRQIRKMTHPDRYPNVNLSEFNTLIEQFNSGRY